MVIVDCPHFLVYFGYDLTNSRQKMKEKKTFEAKRQCKDLSQYNLFVAVESRTAY